jgi:hypothetical protein
MCLFGCTHKPKQLFLKNNIDTAHFHVVSNINGRILQAKATIFKNNIDTAPFSVVWI